MSLDLLGATSSDPKPSKMISKKERYFLLSALLGLPAAAGALLGWTRRKSAADAVTWGLAGGVVGFAGCAASNPDYILPGKTEPKDGGPSSDALPTDLEHLVDLSGPTCRHSLSGVATSGFTIKFNLRASAIPTRAPSTLLYQRAACDDKSSYWDLRLLPDGAVALRLCSGTGTHDEVISDANFPVNDGEEHTIEVKRVAADVRFTIDGHPAGGGKATAALIQLPALGVAEHHPCESATGMQPLDGEITKICLTIP